MSTTLQSGWWVNKETGNPVWLVGVDVVGDPVFIEERSDGFRNRLRSLFCEEYIPAPECTGWDWVAQPTPVDPLNQPEAAIPDRIPLMFWVPRRVLDDPAGDWPVRCCQLPGEVSDTATWVPVKVDSKGNFYVER